MHELSVIQALLHQVDVMAAAHEGTVVRRVTVTVGPLSGFDPQLLASAFAAARTGSASQTDLVLEESVVRLRCRDCGAESEVPPNRMICAQCRGFHTTLLCGDELVLRRVEFQSCA
jgi:hydrogenase nickel incorporation protein HypA/HybF